MCVGHLCLQTLSQLSRGPPIAVSVRLLWSINSAGVQQAADRHGDIYKKGVASNIYNNDPEGEALAAALGCVCIVLTRKCHHKVQP